MSGLVWYGIFKSKAKIQAERFLYNPSLEDIKRVIFVDLINIVQELFHRK